ncbi:MAG: CoA pyrophosphatase [Pseudomonadota bacterium]
MAFTTLDDLTTRARRSLDPVRGQARLPEGGDLELVDDRGLINLREAAVLVPLIPRYAGPTALLTKRPDTMAKHPGQVAFPGGKVDPRDDGPIEAALREAEEEVSVVPDTVELIGRSAPYLTGTGFRITPVLGILPPEFEARPDEKEVDAAFEVPLSILFDPERLKRQTVMWEGRMRAYYEMDFQGFRIWGVTAGIIRTLYIELYGA